MEGSRGPLGIAALAVDSEDNLLITGTFSGTFDFGDGPVDAGEKGTAFVAKLDPNGALSWERHFDAALGFNLRGSTLAVAKGDDVIVTAAFDGTADFGDGPHPSLGEDIVVLRLSASGETLWSRRFGGPGNTLDQVTSVALGPAGEIALSGDYEGALDLGTGPLPWSFGSAFFAALDPDGQTLYSGAIPEAACGYNGCQVPLAFDAEGKLVVVASKVVDPMSREVSPSLFDLVVGPTGEIERRRDFGGRSAWRIAAGGPGELWLAGDVGGAVLARIDAAGEVAWSGGQLAAEGLGDYNAGGRAVAVDAAGSVLVAGNFRGAVDFGGGALQAAGKYDVFVASVPRP